MRLLLCAALAALLAAPAASQSLHGRVTDATTGAPLAGVRLTLLGAGGDAAAHVVSAPNGRFRLAAPGPGAYRVSAERLGYRATLTREVELSEGASVEAEVRMAPVPLTLETVTARGTVGRGVHGRVIDDATGEGVPGATVTLLSEAGR